MEFELYPMRLGWKSQMLHKCYLRSPKTAQLAVIFGLSLDPCWMHGGSEPFIIAQESPLPRITMKPSENQWQVEWKEKRPIS